MRAGRDLLRVLIQPADQRISQVGIAEFRTVVLEADVNCETLGKQHLGGDAIRIPRIPSPRQSRLHLLVLR